jgi:hypothetical protein
LVLALPASLTLTDQAETLQEYQIIYNIIHIYFRYGFGIDGSEAAAENRRLVYISAAGAFIGKYKSGEHRLNQFRADPITFRRDKTCYSLDFW